MALFKWDIGFGVWFIREWIYGRVKNGLLNYYINSTVLNRDANWDGT
jgi:hypothetical protein